MAEGSTSRLLAAVWGNRKGFVFIPHKDLDRRWNETPGIPYSGEVPPLDDLPRGDVYFCPVVFSQPKRKKEFACPTTVLWADLDPVHPDRCRLRPSIAWESSPGRYQALWFLTSEVSAEDASAMSKRIAYADGADLGGWDITQVLRLPGTKNYKYPSTPDVQLLWAKRNAYSVSEVLAAYPPVNGNGSHPVQWQEIDETQIQTAITSLPIGIRRRLTRDTAGADRSLELQKLARDILHFGVSPEVAVHVLQRSTFNKFAGRADEHAQLLKQVESAAVVIEQRELPKTSPEAREPIEAMEVHTWASFLQQTTTLRWLVDDAWVDQTVGFISGRSKSYKTWIALDLALSIVSGRAFLGRYPVRRTGPVLLIQEEDPASILQDRLRIISKNKDMLPHAEVNPQGTEVKIHYPHYPLHIINLQGFSLGVQEKVDQVRHLIAELNPVMVILDPLVVMMGNVDEYKASEVATVLQSVKMWREEFKCSVVIVHHWNKSKVEDAERGGQHMYGSFAFHAWLESALHVMPVIEEEQERIDTVVVEREFKAAPSGRSLKLKFEIDTSKNYTYEVKFEDDKSISARGQQIIDLLASAGGGLTTPELVAMTGFPRPKLVEEMSALVRIKAVHAKRGGGRGKSTKYWLPDQPEPTD